MFTMNTIPTVILKPGEADRVVAGHPWIYDSSILKTTQPPVDGDVVQVKDHRQRFLGMGFYNSKSKIHVRVLSHERVEFDTAFFTQRIQEALAVRARHLPKATSFRVVNAESDFLSGLIVDKYEDVLVVQTSSLGMDKRKHLVISALNQVLKPRAILERNDIASRKFEGLPACQGLLSGNLDGINEHAMAICLNGLRFNVDLSEGHKTGLYLDQQDNYRRVAELIKSGLVLDCFSFVGGFGLHAAQAGAQQVHFLDQSADAIALATANAKANALEGACSFEAINVFDWLKQNTTTGPHEKLVPKFDAIILDPPSFTRNRAAVPDAMRGYKEIHIRALKLLKPGGILATFCCSHHVDANLFLDVILDSAFDTRRTLRRVAVYQQSPDHPVIPAIPETEYLKGFAFEVCN